MFTFFIAIAVGIQTSSAQFPISIPKTPKIEKPKVEQSAMKGETEDDGYDKGVFDKIKWGNNELLKPYLEYAKKHNLETIIVRDSAFREQCLLGFRSIVYPSLSV